MVQHKVQNNSKNFRKGLLRSSKMQMFYSNWQVIAINH